MHNSIFRIKIGVLCSSWFARTPLQRYNDYYFVRKPIKSYNWKVKVFRADWASPIPADEIGVRIFFCVHNWCRSLPLDLITFYVSIEIFVNEWRQLCFLLEWLCYSYYNRCWEKKIQHYETSYLSEDRRGESDNSIKMIWNPQCTRLTRVSNKTRFYKCLSNRYLSYLRSDISNYFLTFRLSQQLWYALYFMHTKAESRWWY